MNRTLGSRRTSPLVPRPLRAAAAAASVAGIVVLAGCSVDGGSAAAEDPATDPATDTATTPAADEQADADAPAASDADFADGTYTAEGSYATPESVETISVTLTLEDDVITDVEVVGNPSQRESKEHQAEFIGGIASVVVGKRIDEISVSRVAGSSLTSGGFNQAVEAIKAEAAQ